MIPFSWRFKIAREIWSLQGLPVDDIHLEKKRYCHSLKLMTLKNIKHCYNALISVWREMRDEIQKTWIDVWSLQTYHFPSGDIKNSTSSWISLTSVFASLIVVFSVRVSCAQQKHEKSLTRDQQKEREQSASSTFDSSENAVLFMLDSHFHSTSSCILCLKTLWSDLVHTLYEKRTSSLHVLISRRESQRREKVKEIHQRFRKYCLHERLHWQPAKCYPGTEDRGWREGRKRRKQSKERRRCK